MEKQTKVREGWDDMLKAVRDKNKQQPNGGAGKKQGSAYGGSKQKDEKPMKEKMDPVGKADADIDNDGDVDKSDKYLHNRRKAIKKSMGTKGETATMNPKMSTSSVNELSQNKRATVMVVKPGKDAQGKSHPVMRVPREKQREYLARGYVLAESKIRESLISVLEKKDQHTKGAIAQPMDDNLSGEGAKKMKKDHEPVVKLDVKDVIPDTQKAVDTVSKAKGRNGDNQQGDKKIVNPVDDVTKKAGYKTETFIDKISALYKEMLK